MRRLKIISNGEPLGTKVVDAETGEDFSNSFTACRITIASDNHFVPRVWLETFDIELELTGDLQEIVRRGPG